MLPTIRFAVSTVARLLLIFICSNLVSISLWAQDGVRYTEGPEGTMMCAWGATGLHATPSMESPVIVPVLFGEKLQLLGQRAYVINENRTYLQVRSVESEIGWIFDSLLVKEGEIGVIVSESPVFMRPQTPSTVTLDRFQPGELVIVATTHEGWAKVTGERKKNSGWVEKKDKVSTDPQDVQLATLWQRSALEPDPTRKKQLQAELVERAMQTNSPLAPMMQQAGQNERGSLSSSYARSSIPSSAAPLANRPYADPNLENMSNMSTPANQPPVPSRPNLDGMYTDMAVAVQPDPARQGIYYAFHRSLDYGTKIRLELPDQTGYIEVMIIGQLSPTAQGSLGLPEPLMKALFGSSIPRNVSYRVIN